MEKLTEKEMFINNISIIPLWIKTEEDWKNYAKHLNYRLIQAQAKYAKAYKIIQDNLKDDAEKYSVELFDIQTLHDDWYNYSN